MIKTINLKITTISKKSLVNTNGIKNLFTKAHHRDTVLKAVSERNQILYKDKTHQNSSRLLYTNLRGQEGLA